MYKYNVITSLKNEIVIKNRHISFLLKYAFYFDDFKDYVEYSKKDIKEHANNCNNIIRLRIFNDLKVDY